MSSNDPRLPMNEKLYYRRKPCPHDVAKWDRNSDWPGLVCANCGETIQPHDEKNFEGWKG